jgi:hypothetical protein
MRSFMLTLALFLSVGSLLAQIPVKHDIFSVLGDIPSPPASAVEAFTHVTLDAAGAPSSVSAEAWYARVASRLKTAEDAYKAQEPAVRSAVPPGMSPEMARMAQDPEVKKKMKAMSKEERMKYAMSMMNAGAAPAAPTLKPEPPEVQAAFTEWQKIASSMQAEFDRGVQIQNSLNAEREADQRAHDAVREWEAAEIRKLPQISSGEMSAPDPVAVKKVRLLASDKHLAIANKRLSAFATVWKEQREHLSARYATFSAKLIAADYAAGSPNPSTQKILSDGQMTLLKDVATIAQLSREACESAASWVALRRAIEQQH